jgi:hypothetical protein
MASNIRKSFDDVTGEEEVTADNELDECRKKWRRIRTTSRGREEPKEGRKTARKTNQTKAGTSGGWVSIRGPPSRKSNYIDYFVRRPRGLKKE